MSNVIHADDSTLDKIIKDNGRIVIKFGADWCRPCKAMAPIIEEVAGTTEAVKFVEVDTEESPAATAEYSVRGLPTFVLVEGDAEIGRKTGTMTKAQLVEWVK